MEYCLWENKQCKGFTFPRWLTFHISVCKWCDTVKTLMTDPFIKPTKAVIGKDDDKAYHVFYVYTFGRRFDPKQHTVNSRKTFQPMTFAPLLHCSTSIFNNTVFLESIFVCMSKILIAFSSGTFYGHSSVYIYGNANVGLTSRRQDYKKMFFMKLG